MPQMAEEGHQVMSHVVVATGLC